VEYVREKFGYSLARACKLLNLPRSLYYYKPRRDDQAVINKLKQLAAKYPEEGQDKYCSRIRNEGLKWNPKRIRRVYRQMNLQQRSKPKKRLPLRVKEPMKVPTTPNHTWSMDFMSDALENGRKFRILNIIDDYNREAIAIEPNISMGAAAVLIVLTRMVLERGKPKFIRVDNGPEFISKKLSAWCMRNGIALKFIQPGKPMQNAYIERFNRSYRASVLDAHIFSSLGDVRSLSAAFIEDYNNGRPHESLGNKSPIAYRLSEQGA